MFAGSLIYIVIILEKVVIFILFFWIAKYLLIFLELIFQWVLFLNYKSLKATKKQSLRKFHSRCGFKQCFSKILLCDVVNPLMHNNLLKEPNMHLLQGGRHVLMG